MADETLPAPARKAAEAAYRNWRIGDDGEGRLHAALVAYAAAERDRAAAEADQALRDRMAAMEATIREAERERIAQLAADCRAIYPDPDADGLVLPFTGLIREPQERSDDKEGPRQ